MLGQLDEIMGDDGSSPSERAEDWPSELRNPLEDLASPPSLLEPRRDILPGVVVGQELARTLRLYVGDEVNIVSPLGDLGPSGPMPKSRPFRVAGIFYSGMYEYDMKSIYVTLETAQRFLNMEQQVTGIDIKVREIERAHEVASEVRAAIARDELRVRDWKELNKNLFGALALEKLAMFITLGIAILVAGFCVFGILILLVEEKVRDVAILKALGATARTIGTIFMIEGLLTGLLGASIGLGVGFVVCYAAGHFGIPMNPEVYYIDKLPVHIDPVEFVLVGVAGVLICLGSTVMPAVYASRVRPVDGLRHL
jgi:lipoprotein-releasing system permease protein